jgi:hypothetical protein
LQSWRAVVVRRATEQHKAQFQLAPRPTPLRPDGRGTYTSAIVGRSLLGAGGSHHNATTVISTEGICANEGQADA